MIQTQKRVSDAELLWRIEAAACALNPAKPRGARNEAKREYDRAKNALRELSGRAWGPVPPELPPCDPQATGLEWVLQ